jgi:hypothetical protein
MVDLIELSEENWMDFAGLTVDESQRTFLASNIGIIARGYVYRNSRAKVIGIVADGTPVGLAMVRDMDDEPACYELQQFMIDKNFQGQGYGFRALELILAALKAEQKYACVEVCVKREDVQAIRVYEKAGFVDSGYIDDTVPDCLNFVYRLVADNGKTDASDIRIVSVEEAAEKQRISRSILEALPEWFGIPEAREQYIKESAAQPFFAALAAEKPIGFLCLKETGKETVELSVMGVLKDYHRKGIGQKLFEQAKTEARNHGYSFMQVKTVKMGRYVAYDATNRFYRSLGFKEFELFPTLWDERNPCQIYVMTL